MDIETASGQNVQNATEDQLKKSLAGLGGENDFLILSDGGNYIQCAGSSAGFIAEYQDESGHYSAGTSLSAGVIEEIFTSYLSRSEKWKSLANWAVDELPGSSPGQERPASFRDALKGEISADELFGAVKKQVSGEVGRGVSRKASGLVGKMVRKIIK